VNSASTFANRLERVCWVIRSRRPTRSKAKLTPPSVAIWLSGLAVEAVVPEPWPVQL
jgi:hypothetical protein